MRAIQRRAPDAMQQQVARHFEQHVAKKKMLPAKPNTAGAQPELLFI